MEHNQPKVTKEQFIKAGLFMKLGPDLAKELGVSLAYITAKRAQYRDDPDFSHGGLYEEMTRSHSVQEYLDAGLFKKTNREVAKVLGVGISAVENARDKVRRDPPPGIDPGLIKPQYTGAGRGPRLGTKNLCVQPEEIETVRGLLVKALRINGLDATERKILNRFIDQLVSK